AFWREVTAAVVAPRVEDVGVRLARAEIRPDHVHAVPLGGERRALVDTLEVREIVDLDVGTPGDTPIDAAREEDVPVVVPEVRPRGVEAPSRRRERRPPLVVEMRGERHRRPGVDAHRRTEHGATAAAPRREDVLERLALGPRVALVHPRDDGT